jgi:hypothetical protein
MWVLYNKKLNPDAPSEPLPKALSYDHSKIWNLDSANVFAEENRELLRLIEWIDMGGQYSNTVGY